MSIAISSRRPRETFVLVATLVFNFLFLSLSSDPDPLQDFCIGDTSVAFSVNGFPCKASSDVTADDFFYDGLSREISTNNSFGSGVIMGNVLAFPGLNTLGISMNRVEIAPGGINPPHLHPRATESGIVVNGTVLVGLITTGNVFYSKNLTAGEMFVVPRGLVHFQFNIGTEKALIFTAFNSHLPGNVLVAVNLFGSNPAVPDDVLSKAFLVDRSVVDEIKSKFGG
ncbi:germin-like protein subfamily T member 2 [Andrographis paniculata]|uniref:germin-like protein subfamily T member 2 n=1 Tax=Andrographis paniculata TaxID=175694 RepID=UPI0021E96E5D|nr:germin-like protein subfamily T member 2 [Andrographis paniculata]